MFTHREQHITRNLKQQKSHFPPFPPSTQVPPLHTPPTPPPDSAHSLKTPPILPRNTTHAPRPRPLITDPAHSATKPRPLNQPPPTHCMPRPPLKPRPPPSGPARPATSVPRPAMAFTLYALLQAGLLVVNAIAVLHEERFLRHGESPRPQNLPPPRQCLEVAAGPRALLLASRIERGGGKRDALGFAVALQLDFVLSIPPAGSVPALSRSVYAFSYLLPPCRLCVGMLSWGVNTVFLLNKRNPERRAGRRHRAGRSHRAEVQTATIPFSRAPCFLLLPSFLQTRPERDEQIPSAASSTSGPSIWSVLPCMPRLCLPSDCIAACSPFLARGSAGRAGWVFGKGPSPELPELRECRAPLSDAELALLWGGAVLGSAIRVGPSSSGC